MTTTTVEEPGGIVVVKEPSSVQVVEVSSPGPKGDTGAVASVSGTAPITLAGTDEDPVVGIVPATPSVPGSMSAADKTKLDGVAAGATANSSDANLRNRSTHTGTQLAETISDFAASSRAIDAARNVNLLTDYLTGTVGTAAENTAALTAAIAALPSGGTISIGRVVGDLPLNALTVASPKITLLIDSCTTLRWATLGAGVSAITVTASDFTILGGVFRGPSAAAYVGAENFVSMIGTSTSVRKSGLTIRNAEIYNFGSYAIYAQFVDKIDVTRNYIHDCGFSAATFLSCDNGEYRSNTIDNITPGVSTNAYGLSLSHDSTGYVGGGKAATHPFCRGWVVQFNEVSRINWEGLDCHGGYEVNISHNRVYATRKGICAPSSSGAALDYAGYQNIVSFNVVDGRNKNGTVSGYENIDYGINLNGGSVVNNQKVVCVGNIVAYKGATSSAASGAILATYCSNAIVSSNSIDFWGGNAVYAAASSAKISDNYFGGMASVGDTFGYCISSDTGTGVHLTITGNTHDASSGGNVANVGVRLASLTSPSLYAAGNDFSKCATPLGGTGYTWLGGQFGNTLSATSGDTTPSVKTLQGATEGVLLLPAAAAYTITNLGDGVQGQTVCLINTGTFNVTVDRSNSLLNGTANQVIAPKYSLTLKKIGSLWYQMAPMSANG